MPKISTQANLYHVCTNNCLRATAIKALDKAGVEARHFTRISGHQSILSIDSYIKRLSNSKKEEINDILSVPFVTKPLKKQLLVQYRKQLKLRSRQQLKLCFLQQLRFRCHKMTWILLTFRTYSIRQIK